MSGRGRLQDGPLCEPLAPASPQGQNCGENGGRCLGVAVGCWSERTGAPRHRSGKQKCVGVQTLYIFILFTPFLHVIFGARGSPRAYTVPLSQVYL